MRQGRLARAVAAVAVAVAVVAGEEAGIAAAGEAAAVAGEEVDIVAGEEVGIVAVAGLGILRLRLHRSCHYTKVRLDDEQGTARLWTHLIFSKLHFCCLAPVLSHRWIY